MVNYVDDLLRRGQAFHDLLSDRLFAHPCHEVLCDLVVYVSVQECHANLAHSVPDVLFVELAAPLQPAEYAAQFP